VPDAPRLLHVRSQFGYTSDPTRALFAEPEAISIAAQSDLARSAAVRARETQLREWGEHRDEIERRIDWLYSQRLRRDVRQQLRSLRYQLDRLDEKVRRDTIGAARS
jgi:hypothetical protein